MDNPFDAHALKPMLIGKTSDPFDDDDFLFELKLDGERCLAYLDGQETVLVNRNGVMVLPRVPELKNMHKQALNRCILDGELITGNGRKEDFEGIKTRMSQHTSMRVETGMKQYPVTFVAFDILYYHDADVMQRPLLERKELLAKTIKESQQLVLSRYVERRGRAYFDAALEQGMEGIIAKGKQSLYFPGKRTKEWIKIKHVLEDDFVICGYALSEHVAMLLLGQYGKDGALHYKGRTTLGRRTEDFRVISQVPRASKWPFKEPSSQRDEKVVWLKPELVCRVEFLQRFAKGSMRQPHFHSLRWDLKPEDAIENKKA